MERIPVAMIRKDLDNIPDYSLPPGYKFRMFRRGEERVWAEIQVKVGAFEDMAQAMERYEKEFSPHLDEFEKRCIFLVEEATDKVIGSTTAWYHPDREGDDRGRIHWVAIIPEFQGRKLAKPMLTAAMRLLQKSHNKVHLWTETTCIEATNMYLDYGFVPSPVSERFDEAWGLLAEIIAHPALESYKINKDCRKP